MSFIDWSSKFDIQVDAMNKEHKHLMDIMNRLHVKFEAKASKDDYTVKHFGDEERYLDSIQYPEAEKHKLIHKDLLAKFGTHKSNFDKSGVLEATFFDFLKMWLSAHIQGIDMKYGQFSKAKKTA